MKSSLVLLVNQPTNHQESSCKKEGGTSCETKSVDFCASRQVFQGSCNKGEGEDGGKLSFYENLLWFFMDVHRLMMTMTTTTTIEQVTF